MNIYNLDEQDAIGKTASTGWVLKWKIKNTWVKTPCNIVYWRGESYAEIIASAVCKDLNIKTGFVRYKPCLVNLKSLDKHCYILCCESIDFCYDYARLNKEITSIKFITFDKLLNLSNNSIRFEGEGGYIKLINTISEITHISKLDITGYLEDTIFLDYLICNFDRHLNNLGTLYLKMDNTNGIFRLAPIFDNGDSLGLDRFEEGNNGKFNRAQLHTDRRMAKPFYTTFTDELSYIRRSRRYKVNEFKHTKLVLSWIYNNFSTDHNIYNVINPITSGSLSYIQSMLETNYRYYLNTYKNKK